jgi:eukaryotic-like serine/threonine-protein kinase
MLGSSTSRMSGTPPDDEEPLPTAVTDARKQRNPSDHWTEATDAVYGPDFAPGAILGEYIVEEMRFKGGFAAVYLGRHAASGRPVALKVLHKDLVTSPEMVRRFAQEAETVRRLGHPHIVEILGFGELSVGQPYIVMEWLAGHNLDQELSTRGPFTPAEALAVMEELGSALSAAHAQGVVHRDLKAANVVCLPEGDWFKIKLVDFGVAKLIDPKVVSDLTTSGKIVGTPLNMAPEQILTQPVDERTDIYAMGLMLYQLVTGRLPFRGRNAVEIEELQLHAPPPRPSDSAPVSRAFDAVVARALRKEKAQRYPDVGSFLEELRAAVREPALSDTLSRAPRAVGVLVEARITGTDDPDDDTLDDLDMVLIDVRATLSDAGLGLALETAGTILGTTILPTSPVEERAARRKALDVARELSRRLETRPAASPHVAIAVSVHAQTSREILRFGEWSAGRSERGFAATAQVLDGLDAVEGITRI